jgi:acetyl esterase/lipase
MAKFTGVLGFLRLLRIKLLVGFSRLMLRLLVPAVKSHPDAIIKIPSREKGTYINANVYKPPVGRNASPSPVLVNFFGSGLAMPLHGSDDAFCRRIANEAGYTVLDVSYRLAPEHPFPAAINDIEDAILYVLSQPALYDSSKFSISGFSSGGTLALIATQLFPRDTFASLIAFYPATNLAVDPALRKPPVATKPRSPYWTRIFRAGYIRDADRRDPRISPAFAGTEQYPRQMMVFTGELDTSALESEELAERAREEGQGKRNVVIKRMKGCGHGFDKRPKTEEAIRATEESYGLVVEMLKGLGSRN